MSQVLRARISPCAYTNHGNCRAATAWTTRIWSRAIKGPAWCSNVDSFTSRGSLKPSPIAAPSLAPPSAVAERAGCTDGVQGLVPPWPGKPGRDGLPLRHAEHKFQWTRQEFQCWAIDLANSFGYDVSFEDIGHVVNEPQVLQSMVVAGEAEGEGEPPLAQAAGVGTPEDAEMPEAQAGVREQPFPDIDVELEQCQSEAEAAASGRGLFDEQLGQAVEVLGGDQQPEEQVRGTGGQKAWEEQQQSGKKIVGFGGATQMAVFTLKDGAWFPGMSVAELHSRLLQPGGMGVLQTVMVRNSQARQSQAIITPHGTPIKAQITAAIQKGNNVARVLESDNASVAGSIHRERSSCEASRTAFHCEEGVVHDDS